MTPPDLERRERRRRRRGTILLVVTLLGLVVAVGSTVAAFVVRHETDDLGNRADPVHQRVRQLAAVEEHAERRLRALRTDASATRQALTDLFAAEQAQVEASNHAVDVANQAVDDYNDARAASVAAAFQTAGDAALADVEQRTAVVRGAADTVRRLTNSVQGASSGP